MDQENILSLSNINQLRLINKLNKESSIPQGGKSSVCESLKVTQSTVQLGTKKEYYILQKLKKIQKVVYLLLEDPSSSLGAKILNYVIFGCILLSTASTILLSTKNFEDSSETKDAINSIESVIGYVFMVEFIIRFLTATAFDERLIKFLVKIHTITDFLSILPSILEIIFDISQFKGLKILKTIRLTRMLRLLKLSRYVEGVAYLTEGARKSASSLGYVLIVMMILDLVFATACYYVEKACGIQGSPFSIQSILDGMWWGLVTMATVGYGEKIPQSFEGKLIATLAAITGMLVIALPVAVLGNNFQNAYSESIEAEMINDKKDTALQGKETLTDDQKEIFL